MSVWKKKKKTLSRSWKRPPDWLLLFLVFFLTIFGVVMVYDSSAFFAYDQFGDSNYFLFRQALGAIVGLVLFLLVSLIDYRIWRKLSPFLLLACWFFLILVLIPGIGQEVYGARRRITFLGIPFQPSEVAKFAVIIFLSHLLSDKDLIKRTGKVSLAVGLTVLVTSGLIMLEPDMGTTMTMMGAVFVALFLSPFPLWLLCLSGIVVGSGSLFFIVSSPYRLNRLKAFLDPAGDTLSTSYHINQILIALGSGGFTGLGLGYSRQKYQYLPEVVTDSIFAVIGEELGFIGAGLVVLALFMMVLRGVRIARLAPDLFGTILAGGISALIGFQILLNLGSMVSLMPLTGLPLPLISYGRTSLIINLTELGVLLNISRWIKEV